MNYAVELELVHCFSVDGGEFMTQTSLPWFLIWYIMIM